MKIAYRGNFIPINGAFESILVTCDDGNEYKIIASDQFK